MPTVLVDDREKKPYQFPGLDSVEQERLSVGDYTHDGFEDTYAVERKTLDDLATSVGSERLRFENEIRRANGFAHRNEDGNPLPGTKPDSSLDEFVVVIEAHPDEVYRYAGNGHCPNYYSNIYPNSVIGTVEKWPSKYETLNFVWAGDREDGKQETLRLLDRWFLKYNRYK
jgi:hypothetical protein